jgi:hypothetical protein
MLPDGSSSKGKPRGFCLAFPALIAAAIAGAPIAIYVVN